MNGWLEDAEPGLADQPWPMAPSHLLPLERWLWWEQLWADVVRLRRRYRLVPAKDCFVSAARRADASCSGWDPPMGYGAAGEVW